MTSKGTYNLNSVVDCIIESSNDKCIPITNVRLQKLLYYVEGLYLYCTGGNKPCFSEDILALSFGPVVLQAYTEYANYGVNPILKPNVVQKIDYDGIRFKYSSEEKRSDLDATVKEIVDLVNELFRDYSDMQLVSLTHKVGGPWHNHYKIGTKEIIPKEEIYTYFKGLLENE